MIINVSTHQGTILKNEASYIHIHTEDLEFGILKNHLPVITIINNGYIRIENNKEQTYVLVIGGVFEYHNNVATLLAQEAYAASNMDEAKLKMEEFSKSRKKYNQQETIDFTKKEKELRDHVKNVNASSL